MDDNKTLGWLAIPMIAVMALTLLIVVLGVGADEDDSACTPGGGSSGSSAGGGSISAVDGAAPPTKPGTTQVSSGFKEPGRPDHQGTDYAGPDGTPIYAYADGRVVDAGPATGFGNWIVIDHNIDGQIVSSVYGHMWDDGVGVQTGDEVKAGQEIGKIGSNGESSGPHLHFEIWPGGRLAGGSPVDPAPMVQEAEAGGGGADGGDSEDESASESGGESAPSGDGGAAAAPEAEAAGGLSPRQAGLAKLTVAIGERMGISEKGIIVALATESRESGFRNLANDGSYSGDDGMPATPEELRESLKYPNDGVGSEHASVNMFQQQVNYWGTVEELMDPVNANRKFYDALKKVDGWEQMPVTVAAQEVQGSDYPDAYAEHEAIARPLYEQFKGAGEDLSEEDLKKLAADGTADVAGGAESCTDTGTGAVNANVKVDPNDPFGERVIAAASKWIGTRYSWGGGTVNGPSNGIRDGGAGDAHMDYANPGFDCSALVQYAVYHASGGEKTLTRTTTTQVAEGEHVDFADKRPGDIIYFGSPPHHTGIYHGTENGKDMLLNAPQSGQEVSIMPLDNWSHEAMEVRRMG